MTAPLFLGIDLAWKPVNRTGLAVVDDTGRLLASGSAITDDDLAAWTDEQPGTVVTAAVDAPLVVPNETGQRLGESEVARAYGRYRAAPYPSSKANPLFDPPRASTLAERFGWTVDPANHGSVAAAACVEVYPHPAMVALFGLDQRIAYKRGPARAQGFVQLVPLIETIQELALGDNPRWRQIRAVVASPMPGDLNRIEDEVDAILCAHLAWLWHHRADALRVYGSLEAGYIVAPGAPAEIRR